MAEARQDELPLVITSRPDEALRGLDAALIRLEPLTEKAAIDCICRVDGMADDRQITRLAEVAQLAEAPLYLRLARELYASRKLAPVPTASRLRARTDLLERWRESLLEGSIRGACI